MEEKKDIMARRRQEILQAALKVMSEKGYQKTGVADIAAELGIGHGTFYRYFQNKQDVAAEALKEVIRRIADVVQEIPAENIDTLEQYREQLNSIGDALFGLMEREPMLARWVAYETLELPKEAIQTIDSAFSVFASFTEAYLKNGIEKGFLRKDIPTRQSAYAINAMLFEAAKHMSKGPASRDKEKKMWARSIIDLMLDGLAER